MPHAHKPRLILVGNGMAGMRTLEELLALAPDKYSITVFGAEPHGNYNRILLSPLLAGETHRADIMLHEPHWYAERGITLHTGQPVTRIDRRRRRVIAADGLDLPYDRLLLATGSTPFILPVPGVDLPGVSVFRTLADVETLLERSTSARRAVVIGAGLLGLEAAVGLHKRGLAVTVVHRHDWPLERQLDAAAGALLVRELEQRGLHLRLGAETAALLGETAVSGVQLRDGSVLDAELVVMAVGIRPNTELARAAGLHCERGVLVDDTMQTFDPRIYAVGECVQHRNAVYGLVAPLWEQAAVCANHLAGWGYARYAGSVAPARLKVSGLEVYSAGNPDGPGESIVFSDPARGIYKKLLIDNNRLTGAVLCGDVADGPWYFELLRERADIADLREALIFGRAA